MIKVGEIYETNNYGTLEVIEYVNSTRVRVRFIGTGYERYAFARHVREGVVKDHYCPSIYGIGYLGIGEYPCSINSKITKVYSTWYAMFTRCYDPKWLSIYPTYKGCKVSPEWYCLQDFGAWFDKHYIEGLELDKDTRIKGNKIYSPDTCMFITQDENKVAAQAITGTFCSPETERIEVYNIAEFARERGLSKSGLYAVKNGKRKTHKGWTKWPD